MPEHKLVVNSDLTFRTTDGHIRLLSTPDGLELSVSRWAVLKQLVKYNVLSFRDVFRLKKCSELMHQKVHILFQGKKIFTFYKGRIRIINYSGAIKSAFVALF